MTSNWDEFGGSHPTGISETREFIRVDDRNSGLQDEDIVLFAERVYPIKDGPPEPCMPNIALHKKFASTAKRIRVTVDILE